MLQQQIEKLFDSPPEHYEEAHFQLFDAFKQALNHGEARAAEPDASAPTGWRANGWVKKGILAGFRMGAVAELPSGAGGQRFFDRATFPVREIQMGDLVRVVPGGSSIRDGAFIGKGVICMPPMFINVGAYVASGTMIDSHALVGSCAQVGKNCHISAAAQLGGVLEPVGALPVIIEDEVMVGGNCGVYEGTVVKKGAVLGSGTLLNRSTPVYDLVKDALYTAKGDDPLVIPEGAIVVPGARAVSQPAGQKWGLSLYAAVIVKYRDEKTESRVQLEDLLR
jgi:2,3,4,5-tetrahydropyridine-2,6-dicarboxylate N-succinyltransferase